MVRGSTFYGGNNCTLQHRLHAAPESAGRLNAAGVGTSVYYPHPIPRLVYYREKYGEDLARFPNAARISDQSIALPVGPHLGVDDMNYIAHELTTIVRDLTCSKKN